MKPAEKIFTKYCILFLVLSLSITFKGLTFNRSSHHQSTLYLEVFFVLVLLTFSFFGSLIYGWKFNVTNLKLYSPFLILCLWWFISGALYAVKGDFFLASFLTFFVAVLAGIFIPPLIERFNLKEFFFDSFLIISIIVSIIALFQTIINPENIFEKITGTLSSNRAYLGLYMLVALSVSCYRITEGANKLPKSAIFFSIISIFLSGSRSAQIAMVIVMAPLVFRKISAKKTLLFFFLLSASAFLLNYIGESRMGKKKEMEFEVSDGIKIDKSAGRRILMWFGTWDIITDSPKLFIRGMGFTNYRWEYDKYTFLPFYTNGAHNMYLHVWAETGLIGFFLMMASIGTLLLVSYWRRKIDKKTNFSFFLILGVLATCFTQESLYPVVAFGNFDCLLFIVIGIMLHFSKQREDIAIKYDT